MGRRPRRARLRAIARAGPRRARGPRRRLLRRADRGRRRGPRLPAAPPRPAGWIGFQEADVIRYLDDDFLLFELKPEIRRTLFGQPFETNAYGMHDDPVAPEKPEGTFRIAVLGASMDMGWGVRYQDTYINRLEDWLNADAAGRGSAGRGGYEVLNFAVAAYSPLQRLETLRRKVLAFQPDLVIYSATTLDVRLMEIHLCDMLRKRRRPEVRLRPRGDRPDGDRRRRPAGRRATGS